MCAAYVAAGLPPERFWQITPRLYATEMRGAANRIERERRFQIEAAWMNAGLQRFKRMPPLDKLLPRQRVARQSAKEQQAMFDILAIRMGAK